jgi:hypothetical protein
VEASESACGRGRLSPPPGLPRRRRPQAAALGSNLKPEPGKGSVAAARCGGGRRGLQRHPSTVTATARRPGLTLSGTVTEAAASARDSGPRVSKVTQ